VSNSQQAKTLTCLPSASNQAMYRAQAGYFGVSDKFDGDLLERIGWMSADLLTFLFHFPVMQIGNGGILSICGPKSPTGQ